MSLLHDIGRGFVQSFFSDEIRPIMFLAVIFSVLGYGRASMYVFGIAGVLCSGLIAFYVIETRSVMKFFWGGFALSTIIIAYTSVPDLNNIKLSSDVVLTDRTSQATLFLTAGIFNGYTAEKYLGGSKFIMTASEKVYERDILLLSESSWLESFFVVTCTDDLNLLDMTRLTNKSYVFSIKTGSNISLLEIESKSGFSDLVSMIKNTEPSEGMFCGHCSEREAYRMGVALEDEETQVRTISRHHDDFCESCLMDLLKLATDKGVISKSELYARLA